MKRRTLTHLIAGVLLVIAFTQPASARQYSLMGDPFNLFAYVSQSLQFSLKGDEYDTEKDLQQALFNLLVEADYRPRSDLTLYASSMLTMDLVYGLKYKDKSWSDKLFYDSKDELWIDDEYWQLLKEAHMTWSPGPFLFRLGKQIVSWGEMDFNRIMDQINPLDQRRGFSDVEFESTIIPIWLARAEWWPTLQVGWLEELGFQFIFNPNADFIPDQGLTTGNDAGGIWSAAYSVDNPLYPLGLGTPKMYVGGVGSELDEPEEWDPDEGFEYGARISARINGTILTLNGFYGRENSPKNLLTGFVWDPELSAVIGQPIPLLKTASDGTSLIYPTYKGFYPRQKSVGVTWTGDLPFRSSLLGGVNPVLRMEVRYQIDKVFTDEAESVYHESDFLDTGFGIDWKVKIPALNPRAYFSVSPQFFFNRILDYPSGFKLLDLPDKNYYTVSVFTSTSYYNGKLVPSLAWLWDTNNVGHLIIPKITYSPTREWDLIMEAAFLQGQDVNRSFWLFRNKDYFAIKVRYKFN